MISEVIANDRHLTRFAEWVPVIFLCTPAKPQFDIHYSMFDYSSLPSLLHPCPALLDILPK